MADFARSSFALVISIKVGVPSSWLPMLASLKVAGAVGLLPGLLGIRYIGVAAAVETGSVLPGSDRGPPARPRTQAHHHHVGCFLFAIAALVASIAR
ncbi:hypothetical protein M2302_005826 [Micromonospora sp. A200]|uniref:DoxX family protein n=1 Tax=Micromonospora sp. A200 TaxID=2940568 RepID=UPI002475497F|nr:DoxX family protein [Micromonospora sp. A200]MDH6465624.1 hypothetical protein [Micromonospora sp. A200]